METAPEPFPLDLLDLTSIALIGFAILAASFLMLLFLWLGWRASMRKAPASPYSIVPLRSALELPYATIGKIYLYLTDLHQYDNCMFNIRRAAFCRETGRVFSNFVAWTGRIRWDWSFLDKRYKGPWTSWGSLTEKQKQAIRRAHNSLEGYQTKISCPDPRPRAVTSEYCTTIPGPLYVNLETQELLGWRQVPGTDVEVLVVQKPRRFKRSGF